MGAPAASSSRARRRASRPSCVTTSSSSDESGRVCPPRWRSSRSRLAATRSASAPPRRLLVSRIRTAVGRDPLVLISYLVRPLEERLDGRTVEALGEVARGELHDGGVAREEAQVRALLRLIMRMAERLGSAFELRRTREVKR